MTVCKAQSEDHQVHYAFSRFPWVLLPCLQSRATHGCWKCAQQEAATATQPKLLGGFQQICHVCIASEAHPTSTGCCKSCTEQVLPGSVRNQRQKYRCLMSNIPRDKLAVPLACHAWQAGSPCCAHGANGTNACNVRNIAPAARSCGVATAKLTATAPRISRDRHYLQHCSTTYLLPLLWDFSKIEACPIFRMAQGVSSR